MQRKVLLITMMAVAMFAAAADRFYIEDFSIAAGETRTVSIMLDNEGTYTAFQADLYLPEGLTVEQEDGDYIFDLTNRKARDHNIASQLQHDGAIRVMSYSPRINAFGGNSGPLVTFNVMAATDITGPMTIVMRNILFTTIEGQEVAFADEQCVVSIPFQAVMGDVNGDNNIDVDDVALLINAVLGKDIPTFIEANADMNGDQNIDIDDVTLLIRRVLNSN